MGREQDVKGQTMDRSDHRSGGSNWISYLIARLQKKTRLSAIRSSEIHPTSKVEPGGQVVGTVMGRHSFCGYDCTLINARIGSFCSIADQVYVGGSAHPIQFVSTSPVFLSHRDSVKAKFSHHEFYDLPQTVIGHDVWIGHGAKIRAGVNIGTGAVIGMGAVVAKDVRPYAIVVGNPAREVRRRFDDPTVDGLLASKWWDMDDEALKDAAQYFTDPALFLLKRSGL